MFEGQYPINRLKLINAGGIKKDGAPGRIRTYAQGLGILLMHVSPGAGWCCLVRGGCPWFRLVMGTDSACWLLLVARVFARVLVVLVG